MGSSSDDRGISRSLSALPWASLIALAVVLCFQEVRSLDYWWHLRAGALIFETGAVPTTDPLSYTASGARWIDIHWLFQLALFGAYTLCGHAGAILLKLATTFGVLFLIWSAAERPRRSPLYAGTLGVMLLVLSTRLMARPELPTFLCLAAVLVILDRTERHRSPAWLYVVPGIQLFWVNTHGLFVLGIAVLGIHWLLEVAASLARAPARGGRQLAHLSIALGLSVATALANPNGLAGALYPLRQFGMLGGSGRPNLLGSWNSELGPVFGSADALAPLALGLFLAIATLAAAAMAANWRRLPWSHPLLFVAFLHLGASARRNVALFAIVAGFIAIRNLSDVLKDRPLPRVPGAIFAVCCCIGLAALALDAARGSFYLRVGQRWHTGLGVMDGRFPVGAVEWIAREHPAGPICHHMMDGGYIAWHLYPDYKTMLDGRLELFGAKRFAAYSVGNPAKFDERDRLHHFGVVLVHHSVVRWPVLTRQLLASGEWRLRYVDDVAAVFVRDAPAVGQAGAADGIEEGFAELSAVPSPEDQRRRVRRIDFLERYGMGQRLPALLVETLAMYPDLAQRQPARDAKRPGAAIAARDGFYDRHSRLLAVLLGVGATAVVAFAQHRARERRSLDR